MMSFFNFEKKLKKDIDFQFKEINGIKPISIIGLSLGFRIKKKILNMRNKNSNLLIVKNQKKMSLIIPYRHREENLKQFIPYIKTYLKKQKIDYEIIVVEQVDKLPFNKAKLMNIGAINSRDEADYYVFHDVDLLPENVDYRYCNHTEKLFNCIGNKSEQDYKIYKQTVLGGAVLVPKSLFLDINGYSNNYWQWGREDDDFFMRHILAGYVPLCDNLGRYIALEHEPSLARDNSGKLSNSKNILKTNKKLFSKNKERYLKLRREQLSQYDDGISTLKDFRIVAIENRDEVKYIRVSFD